MRIRYVVSFLIVLALATVGRAEIITKTVSYKEGGVELEGFLAYDNDIPGKRPAILVVHEWWGLNDYARGRAEQLAELGYVAFALDMYGKGKVTQHPTQAAAWMKQVRSNIYQWQQRALAGLNVLKRDPRTDVNRIAAIGYCFGGATVQQLAYSGAALKGVVSFHGSLMLPMNVQVSQVKAKILICHGGADPFIKRGEIEDYISAMEGSGFDYQLAIYGGAKHSFTNPAADQAGMNALKYSKIADQRSWEDMRQFFHEIF